ncbi:MAG TPA: protein translocase subunit SecF [Casimicrobiaceae bacterium]|jgi:preprotein translocase subunit SecF|nr:protein translocase subunit SecF [Casimicrobiaceae bacterium]
MEFFRFRRDIPFMRHALVFNVISLITFLAAVFFLATRGLNFGVDFRGGTVIEVKFAHAVDFGRVRAAIDKLEVGEYAAQSFGTADTALVRLPLKPGVSSAQLSERVMTALKADDPTAQQVRVEFVGPQVGKELYENGALALLLVAIGIVGYLAMRFEWRFALAAIIANLHDVIIIMGFFAFFQWEFSLPVLAALLAVLGYSVNESVVVADRIRENFRKMRKATVTHVIDNAITSTMSRTIITHGSTQIMVTSMLIFGGETLHYFALALTIGILFGIYSSVLVMAPLVMWMGVSREDLVKPEKRGGAEGDKILP